MLSAASREIARPGWPAKRPLVPPMGQPPPPPPPPPTCALEVRVHLLHDVHPQRGAPLHARLLQEQDEAVRRRALRLDHGQDVVRRAVRLALARLHGRAEGRRAGACGTDQGFGGRKLQALGPEQPAAQADGGARTPCKRCPLQRTLRMKPGVSMMVRLGAQANSARITMGCRVECRERGFTNTILVGSSAVAQKHAQRSPRCHCKAAAAAPAAAKGCQQPAQSCAAHLAADGGAQLAKVCFGAVSYGLCQCGLRDDGTILICVLVLIGTGRLVVRRRSCAHPAFKASSSTHQG